MGRGMCADMLLTAWMIQAFELYIDKGTMDGHETAFMQEGDAFPNGRAGDLVMEVRGQRRKT